jgi:hypothetical protein
MANCFFNSQKFLCWIRQPLFFWGRQVEKIRPKKNPHWTPTHYFNPDHRPGFLIPWSTFLYLQMWILCQMVFLEFFSPKVAIFWGETVRICKKHEETTILLEKDSSWRGKEMSIAMMLGDHEEGPSMPTGDRPPTYYYFSTGHRPGFFFLAANLTTHPPPPPPPPGSGTGFGTDTFCHNPYVDGHKIRYSHGICKVAYEKVLEMRSGNS